MTLNTPLTDTKTPLTRTEQVDRMIKGESTPRTDLLLLEGVSLLCEIRDMLKAERAETQLAEQFVGVLANQRASDVVTPYPPARSY